MKRGTKFPTRALGAERLEDIRLQSTDRPGDNPLYACGGGCVENVTSRSQVPERPSLDVKLNPPVSVPVSVRATGVEVRWRTASTAGAPSIVNVFVPSPTTHAFGSQLTVVVRSLMNVSTSALPVIEPLTMRVPDSHATDTSKFSLTDSGTWAGAACAAPLAESNAEPNAARTVVSLRLCKRG